MANSKLEIVDQIFYETVSVIKRSSLGDNGLIDIILLLMLWKYKSERGELVDEFHIANIDQIGDENNKFLLKVVTSLNRSTGRKTEILNPNIHWNGPIIGSLLHSCARIFNSAGNLFDDVEVVKKFFEKLDNYIGLAFQSAHDYVTPPDVSKLVAALIPDMDANSIYDPNCRSGNMLVELSQRFPSAKLFGRSKNADTYRIAAVYFEMTRQSNISTSLLDPFDIAAGTKFDLVVTNPPFGVGSPGFVEYEPGWFGEFRSDRMEVAYLTHSLDMLADHGVCAIIVPNGFVFGGGVARRLRKKLIKENLVDAVISLPSKLFYGINIQTSFLILRKNRSTNRVIFIDATGMATKEVKRDSFDLIQIEHLAKVYHQFLKDPKKSGDHYVIVGEEKIEKHDFNFSYELFQDLSFEIQFRPSVTIDNECAELERSIADTQAKIRRLIR